MSMESPKMPKSARLIIFILMICTPFVSVSAGDQRALSEAEITEYLGPTVASSFRWTREAGPDFDVFYGRALAPMSGKVGLYLGGWPDFEPDNFDTNVQGQLGAHAVKWYRKTDNGLIRQEAVITLDDHNLKAHVWVEAHTQAGIEKLVAKLATLKFFAPKKVGK